MPSNNRGLLFPTLAGYDVRDIDVVVAFDIAVGKVGRTVGGAIFQEPNNACVLHGIEVDCPAVVYRGPTLDGNPAALAALVQEDETKPVDVAAVLRQHEVDVVVNLLPTGSHEATQYYALEAVRGGAAFVNCIPTPLAQRAEIRDRFEESGLPLLGGDIKSQLGTTILHRYLLRMLGVRGAALMRSSQINVGGNTDFLNFTERAESKLVSKRKSLADFTQGAESHVGHHYDTTRGPLKNAHIQLDAEVFGGSPVDIALTLRSDDKPNSAGSIVDLVRIAKWLKDRQIGGSNPEACAFYMKSPPKQMPDEESFAAVKSQWS